MNRQQWIIFIIPIILIWIIFMNKIIVGVDNLAYYALTQEDGIVEYITAIAYFVAFIITIPIIKNVKKNKTVLSIFIVLSATFLIVGLEEISYGQRIIGFTNVELESGNRQGEINIHNLEQIQPHRYIFYLTISLIGAFSWVVIPRISKNELLIKCLPPKFLISYFLIMTLLTIIVRSAPLQFRKVIVVNDYLYPMTYDFFVRWDGELLEMILALGLLFFTIHAYKVIKKFSFK